MRTIKSSQDDRHKNLKELSDGSVELDLEGEEVDGLMDEIDVIED